MNAQDDTLFTDEEWNEISVRLRLSRRQDQIARLVLDGHTDGSVAKETGIAVPTVRTHLSRMFHKLGVGDRLGLALTAFRAFRELCPTEACPRAQATEQEAAS